MYKFCRTFISKNAQIKSAVMKSHIGSVHTYRLFKPIDFTILHYPVVVNSLLRPTMQYNRPIVNN